jgi:hypothetical protein
MLQHNRLQVRHSISREHGDTEYHDVPYRSHGDGDDDIYRVGGREPKHNAYILCTKYTQL